MPAMPFAKLKKSARLSKKYFPVTLKIEIKFHSKPLRVLLISLCVCTEAHVDDVVAITSSIFDVQKIVPR